MYDPWTCTKGGTTGGKGVQGGRRQKGGKRDNYNSIMNKIYLR